MTLCATHRFKQGSPPRLTRKFLFVIFYNSRTGATTIEERAFDQSLVVIAPRPLHDRESLDRAQSRRAQQHELSHLVFMASCILDRNLRTKAACHQMIWR